MRAAQHTLQVDPVADVVSEEALAPPPRPPPPPRPLAPVAARRVGGRMEALLARIAHAQAQLAACPSPASAFPQRAVAGACVTDGEDLASPPSLDEVRRRYAHLVEEVVARARGLIDVMAELGHAIEHEHHD